MLHNAFISSLSPVFNLQRLDPPMKQLTKPEFHCKNDVLELTTEEFNSRGNYFVKVVADERCDECLNCYRHCPDFAIFLRPKELEDRDQDD